jgi:hypothetical protein
MTTVETTTELTTGAGSSGPEDGAETTTVETTTELTTGAGNSGPEEGAETTTVETTTELTTGPGSSRPEDRELAESAYQDLINTVQSGVPASDMLFGESERASYFRGLLLDQPKDQTGASYGDLWTGRIEADVSWRGYASFDLSTGHAGKTSIPVYRTDIEVINRLWEILSLTLKSGYKADLWRFTSRGEKRSPGVIRALFNIPKNATKLRQRMWCEAERRNRLKFDISMRDIVPPYAIRRKLIQFCISECERVGPRQKVTVPIAVKARKRIWSTENDPTGSHRQSIDLSEYTKGFGEKLKEKMEKGGVFLDVLGGATPANDPTIAVSPRPIVTTHLVGVEKGPFKQFWVVTIHNPFTLSFVERWQSDMNRLLFTEGKHGKAGAYIRNASSTEEPAPFTIGRKTVYGGQHLSAFERDGILHLANFVAKYQRETIEEALGDLYIVTFHANLLHTVVNAIVDALYAFHSDADAQVCSDIAEKRIHVEDIFHLPINCEQQVITMGSSNSKLDYSTILEYERVGHGSLACLDLGSCFLHIQGPGSQQPGIRHQVKMTPEATESNTGRIWRFHCTSRLVLCPKRKKLEFEERMKTNLHGNLPQPCDYHSSSYTHKGVLSKCVAYQVQVENGREHEVGVVRLQDELPSKRRRLHRTSDVTGTQWFNLLSPGNTDRYQQLSRRDFDSLGIFRPLPTMLFEGSMLSHLSSAPMTKYLFDNGYIVHGIGSSGTGKKMIPRLHEVPVNDTTRAEEGATRHPIPGEKFLLSRICLDAGMRHTRRAHPMLSPSADDETQHSPIIIITRAYKNDWKKVQAHLVALKKWSEDHTKPLYDEDFDGKLTVFGSGGAPEILGTHPPNYKTDTKFDSQVHIPAAQPFESSKINRSLFRLMLDNQCVAVYVNQDEMFGDGEATEVVVPNCSFLGYFSCAKFVVDRLSAAVVKEQYKDSNQQTQMHAQFLQVPHFRLNLEPIFNNEDLRKMREESNIATDYKILAVELDCEDKIVVDIPFGGAEAALAGLDRSQMYSSFIEKKEFMRYLQNPPDDSESDDDDHNPEDQQDDDNHEDPDEIEELKGAKVSRATIPQLIDACLINNAAGAFRALKKNITSTKTGEVAGPLMVSSLPVICRLQSTPMSNRALDVVCLFLRRECKDTKLFERTNTKEGQRITYRPDYKPDLVELAFKVIMLRFTGRINAFRNYSLHEETGPMIPAVKDLVRFLVFMKRTVKGTRLGPWHSKQHLQAIPASVQEYRAFADFITEVGKILPEVIDTILKKQEQGDKSRDTRKEAVLAIKAMLSTCCGGDTSDGLHFLAQIVVADIDEIFEKPFGETNCDGMIAGHGGSAGMSLLDPVVGKKDLPAVLSLIIDYVQKDVPDQLLAIAGYKKDKAGVVVNRLNGRPFNASDAEHFLCKGSVLAKLTLGHYRNSKYPMSAKPWCHPIKLTREEQPYDAFTCAIMEHIVKSYIECASVKPCLLVIPEVCYLPNEEIATKEKQGEC